MDFSKQLAFLQQSASRAQQRGEGGRGGGDNSNNDTTAPASSNSENGERRPDRRRNDDFHHNSYNNNSSNSHRGRGRGSGRGHRSNTYRSGEQRVTPYDATAGHHHHRGGHGHSSRKRHMTDAEEDYYLKRLVQAIPKYHPLPIQRKQKQRHICLLFLTIDDLPHEHLWRTFLDIKNDELSKSNLMVSAICHAKFPDKVKSPWLKQRLLVHKPSIRDMQQYHERYSRNTYPKNDKTSNQSCLPPMRYFSRKPEWGSVEITRAMIDLLDEGLRIGTNRDNTVSVVKGIKDSRQAQEYRDKYSSQRFVVTDGHGHGQAHGNGHGHGQIQPDAFSGANSGMVLPTVDRFLFISESCIPVVTKQEFESALFSNEDEQETSKSKSTSKSTSTPKSALNDNPYNSANANKSWVNARNTPNNGFARQLQWDSIDPSIPQSHVWKADQWILLMRHHAWPILSLIDDAVQSVSNKDRSLLALWQCFRRVKASDEIYFPTVMSLLGILGNGNANDNDNNGKDEGKDDGTGTCMNSSSGNDGINVNTLKGADDNEKKDSESESASASLDNEVCRKRMTYCDWSENPKNPATFEINRNNKFKELRRVIRLAREEGCLFARKFSPALTLEHHHQAGEAVVGQGDEEGKEAISGQEWLEIVSKMRKL